MKSLLIGNGINIQFGGKAYSNDFVMKRIKYRAKLESYEQIFGHVLLGNEIVDILNNFVTIANEIRNNDYDKYVMDEDTAFALCDFKRRYYKEVHASYEIMLEDWFFILHMFFLKNDDLKDKSTSAIQGFEKLFLDAIYNNSKIQELYLKIPKKAKCFFNDFDNIFTLNYDNNIERLTKKRVYHLHGDFSVLANSENLNNVQGYIRTQENSTVIVSGMEHCYCNALLNYSGKLKYETAKAFHNLIIASEDFQNKYINDPVFTAQLFDLKVNRPFEYEMIMTKITHPELNMATEYFFEEFESIQDDLYIIGMSPNNDGHIFDLILNNKLLHKVNFFYFSETDRKFIEEHYPADLFKPKSVQKLWKSLDCVTPKYNCNYAIPSEIDKFIDCFNALSGDNATKEEILKEISRTPQFEMDRLCRLVKADMLLRNPEHKTTDEAGFIKSSASISYIALQEGLLPSTLYMIYVMNFSKI